MKKNIISGLLDLLNEPIRLATQTLLDRRNETKLCKYTTHVGSTDITMIVRKPPLSGGDKKSVVFEIIIWVKRFVHSAHHKLKRITEVYKLERTETATAKSLIPDFARN
jgi:hypothetical protein